MHFVISIEDEAREVESRLMRFRVRVPLVECYSCGFQPTGMGQPPRRCPKCCGSAWEHFEMKSKMRVPHDALAM